jgi:amino acid transporter
MTIGHDDHEIHKRDMKVLHEMGYAQELHRSMSSFSNFAISFSIICILSGGINSLGQATAGAGGAAIGIGWPVGVVLSGLFAVALAQISSAYPTAGGLYHWGSILGNRFTGWLSAWLNLLGLITVLGAINVGTFYFFYGAFGSYFGLEDNLQTRVAFVALITALQALVNHMGINLTVKLTDLSGYLILLGAVALTAVCLFFAETWDFSRLFTFSNYTGTEGASAVCPGFVKTPHGLREVAELTRYGVDVSDEALAVQQGRLCEPEEVARAALFLASDDASFINGAHLFVDNAFTAV